VHTNYKIKEAHTARAANKQSSDKSSHYYVTLTTIEKWSDGYLLFSPPGKHGTQSLNFTENKQTCMQCILNITTRIQQDLVLPTKQIHELKMIFDDFIASLPTPGPQSCTKSK